VRALYVVQEMNRPMNTVFFVLLCIMAIVAASYLLPFALAGILAFVISGMKFNNLISSCVALALVAYWRISNGEWMFYLNDSVPKNWYYESFCGIVSWAMSAIFVSIFAWLASIVTRRVRSKGHASKHVQEEIQKEAQQAAPSNR
jgi:membrane protein implicated in regulation of membrane protease activity